jgi:hypothetical protein
MVECREIVFESVAERRERKRLRSASIQLWVALVLVERRRNTRVSCHTPLVLVERRGDTNAGWDDSSPDCCYAAFCCYYFR